MQCSTTSPAPVIQQVNHYDLSGWIELSAVIGTAVILITIIWIRAWQVANQRTKRDRRWEHDRLMAEVAVKQSEVDVKRMAEVNRSVLEPMPSLEPSSRPRSK